MSHIRTKPPEPLTTGPATSGPATPDLAPSRADGDGSTDALEHDVERQREELAATVHALSHKLDLKSQAGLKAEELADRATTPSGKPRPELVAVAGGLLAGTFALLWWRRHR